ncbi:hypothetical protein [Candidatus Thiosymbion oneisti]|uniref:hypothetical protein n=1 Tax=Candidatus Thiosymbion oneisti TaxID=589554 RepID=UPI00105E6D40|nr:hypothetical protein [Candidatus Thiosymbion oneisti]
MSANKAKVLVTVIIAIVVVIFVFLYSKVDIRAHLPFGAQLGLTGEKGPPPKPGEVRGTGLEAGGSLTAQNRVGGNVEVEDSSAAGDIHLSTQADGGSPDPKH